MPDMHMSADPRPVTDVARPRAAFQGELGAFSEEAVAQLWANATPVPRRSFMDVARAVEQGAVEFGLLPIENSLYGSVIGSYDALGASAELHVVAETVVAIHHCLVAPHGATVEALRTVASHPVALGQCTRFLERHAWMEARAAYDTAGAARDVAARGDATASAIAGRRAAERYGLAVLAADIEDRPDNQTRFLAVAREPAVLPGGVPARTALLFQTANAPGALLRVLGPLAARGLNLSKLESRPAPEPWSYHFFLEMEHEAGHAGASAAVEEIRGVTQSLRVLGTFAKWGGVAR